MKLIIAGWIGISLVSFATAQAAPDPRDSIILETKTIAADSGIGGLVRLRVWITNKDTLANVSLPLEEKSVAGEAYMLPAHPRDFNGTIVRLTTTLPAFSVAAYSRFDGHSPDSFLITSFYDVSDAANTAEPPNGVRKPLWEILFDTVRVEGPLGSVQFDSVRTLSVSVGFVDLQAVERRVNFIKSTVTVFSRIPAITLVLPAKGAQLALRRPTLVWNFLRDSTLSTVPAVYRVFLSTDSSFAATDTSTVLADTSWKVPITLAWNQKYFWKAIALTLEGDTVFSKSRAFMVIPPVYGLMRPTQNQVLAIRQPSFIWQKVKDTSVVDSFAYRVILAQNPSFTAAETSAIRIDTTWKVPHRLNNNQTYHWRVMAIFGNRDTIFSGSAGRFSTNFSSFSLTLPANNATIQIRRPSFMWQNVPDTSLQGGFLYHLYLAKDTTFSPADTSPPLFNTSWKVPNMIDFTTYYWKVFAISDSGDTVPCRQTSSFLVRRPDLTLSFPLLGSRVFTKQPTFAWTAMRDTSIPDSFAYQVLVGKSPFLLGSIASPLLMTTSWTPPSPLEIATTYFWKVLPFYGSDTIILSDISNFYVSPTRIEVPEDRQTIQGAIEITQEGDTVLVKPGVYTENIRYQGRRIKVISEGGAEVTTIVKQKDSMEVVGFSGGEDVTTLLSGFTITGAGEIPNGAVIEISNASPRIENCRIVDNTADSGAIWVKNGAAKLHRNLIAHNSGQSAVIFKSYGLGEIINCTIADNQGNGIHIEGLYPVMVTNNIVAFNSGFGVIASGGMTQASQAAAPLAGAVTYNDTYGNLVGDYEGISPGVGNLYLEPEFVNRDSLDYRLRGSSPCRDSGDPAFPVPSGGGVRIDMGAFEFVPRRGDLNGDGGLSLQDIVLELNCAFLGIGDCPLNVTDVNCSSSLTAADAILLLNAVFLGIPLPC